MATSEGRTTMAPNVARTGVGPIDLGRAGGHVCATGRGAKRPSDASHLVQPSPLRASSSRPGRSKTAPRAAFLVSHPAHSPSRFSFFFPFILFPRRQPCPSQIRAPTTTSPNANMTVTEIESAKRAPSQRAPQSVRPFHPTLSSS